MRKLVLLLALMLLIPCFTALLSTTKADTLTFSGTTSDGYVEKESSVYNTAWTSSAGDDAFSIHNSMEVGQWLSAGYYLIRRGFLYFDTSSIPDTATITGATLSVYCYTAGDYSDTEFNVTVQNGQPTYPHIPLEVGDYGKSSYSGSGGYFDTTTIVANGYYNITLTELSWLDVDGTTKLILRSSRDIAGSTPTGDELISIYCAEAGESYIPKLSVTYTVPSTPEEGLYSYTFYGPFNEDTGYALAENVNVSVYSAEGAAYDSFLLSTSYVYNVSTLVQFFQFTFEDNTTRQYWVDPSESNSSTIYVFWADSTSYVINFLDTSGILADYPYVVAKRYVNGTLYVMEKRKVDEYGSIGANLINGRTYQLVIGNENVTYVWGDLLMTGSTGVQLTLRGVDFPQETLLKQKYVRIYGYRNISSSDIITVIYEDTKENTVSVAVSIALTDGTVQYSTTLYSNSFTVTWSSANSNTTYVATAVITHGTYGSITWHQTFPARTTQQSLFPLLFLGPTWWGLNTYYIIPAFAIVFVAACFSQLNAHVGAVLTVLTAVILTWMGWIPIPVGSLVSALAFAFLMALIYSKRRVVGY